MKRFVPCLLALLLLLTACSGPEGPAGNPSGDPEPTPVAQGHALPKDNRTPPERARCSPTTTAGIFAPPGR